MIRATEKESYPPGTIVLAVIAAVLFLTQLGSYGLLEPDEGRYAEIGREMALPGGDWLIPRLNGIPHFQKPPVFYWFTAASIKLFGANETAARLPVALSAIGVLLFTMGIANRLFGARAARLALVILATTPLFLVFGRIITPDMTMALWITAAIYCLTRVEATGPWRWLFFVCAGLGFLTKGPVAFLVPFSAAIGFSFTERKASGKHLPLPWFRGVLLSILIGLSWFFLAASRYPELIEYFWKYELVERFGSSTHGRSRPFWFFIPVLLAGFLPWTFAMIHHLPRVVKNRPAELGLFVGWVAVPFVVLSCSGSKLPTYVLPLFSGLAVALGAVFATGVKQDRLAVFLPRHVRVAMALCLLILAAVAIVVTLFFIEPAGAISFGMVAWAVLLTAGSVFWLFRVWRLPTERSIIALAGLLIFGLLPLPFHLSAWNDMFSQQASVKTLAERILAESTDLEQPPRVISCDIRANGLPFYLGRTVEITRSTADIAPTPADSELSKSIATPLHDSSKKIARIKSADGSPVYVVTRETQYQKNFVDTGWELLQTAGDFVLLRR